jgi:hypothetical protein
MKTGVELIAIERQEQLEKHNRSIDQDVVQNNSGQLVAGAIALIRTDHKGFWDEMPVKWDEDICKKMSRKSYKNRLIIAGALIAAEIDRINSVKTKTK